MKPRLVACGLLLAATLTLAADDAALPRVAESRHRFATLTLIVGEARHPVPLGYAVPRLAGRSETTRPLSERATDLVPKLGPGLDASDVSALPDPRAALRAVLAKLGAEVTAQLRLNPEAAREAAALEWRGGRVALAAGTGARLTVGQLRPALAAGANPRLVFPRPDVGGVSPVTFRLGRYKTRWRVARTRPDGKPATVRDALAALAKWRGVPLVAYSGGRIRSLGGYDNQPDGCWWRAVPDDVDQPLGDGVTFERRLRAPAFGVRLSARDYREAADAGDPWSQTVLGICLVNGYGTRRAVSEGIFNFRRAFHSGEGGAGLRLGRCREGGKLLDKDLEGAARYYRRAADAGNASAMDRLARMLREGRGTKADPVAAAKWFARSAALADPGGQFNLAMCYLYGSGVEKDDKQAARYLRAAALQGHVEAVAGLGWCYMNGRGVPTERERAARLLRYAAGLGNKHAKRVLKAQGMPEKQ